MEQRFLIGEAGGNFIQAELSRSDPKKVIQDFQNKNDLEDEASKPILPLLDLHGLTRSEVYGGILEVLKTDLISRVDSLDDKTLDLLLDKTFPYLSIPELEAVPMAILKKHPNVPTQYLHKLAASELYHSCPIEVKRQIWQVDHKLFRDRVHPLLEEYMADEELSASAREIFDENRLTPKKRRDHQIIQNLVLFIGKSTRLYGMVLHFLRSLFVKTGSLSLCTLRAEILMALHDNEITEVVDLDPCHKFAWCLDACIRNNSMEPRRVKEITSYFDQIKSGEVALGDVAMVVLDPYSTHMLVENIYSSILAVVERRGIPKEDEGIRWMSQLVTLGLSARAMLQEQKFKISKVDNEIISDFYTMLACVVIDDKLRELSKDESIEPYEPEFLSIINAQPLAKEVFLHYTLHRVIHLDHVAVGQALALLQNLKSDFSTEEGFFQSLISTLIHIQDRQGENPTLVKTIITETVVPQSQKSLFVHLQLIRFFSEILPKLPLSLVTESIQKLIETERKDEADDHKKKLAEAYKVLVTRHATKLTSKNAPFLYEFIEKQLGKVFPEKSKTERTKSTEHLSSAPTGGSKVTDTPGEAEE